ncbi:hypothetical protein VNO77_06144 [Canavalia gladiata]|uniref:Uncharacterized protein n=1 Tax=Canavalia gladiata TaxID=3824 RepID=A0AAN9M7V2_CANGL
MNAQWHHIHTFGYVTLIGHAFLGSMWFRNDKDSFHNGRSITAAAILLQFSKSTVIAEVTGRLRINPEKNKLMVVGILILLRVTEDLSFILVLFAVHY